MTRDGMTPERWARIEELFDAALAAPPHARETLLERVCGDDTGLRAELQSLLAEHDAEPDFLDTPAWSADDDVAEPVPERIGGFRVLRPLGRGGMGHVFLAEREAAGFRQGGWEALCGGIVAARWGG